MDALTELPNNFGTLTACIIQPPCSLPEDLCVSSGPKTLLDFLRTTIERPRLSGEEKETFSRLFEASQAINLLDDLLRELFDCAKGETQFSPTYQFPRCASACPPEVLDETTINPEPKRQTDFDRCRVTIETEAVAEPVTPDTKAKLFKIIVEGRGVSVDSREIEPETVDFQELIESLIRSVVTSSSNEVSDDDFQEAIVKVTRQVEKLLDQLPVKTTATHCESKTSTSGDDEWTTLMNLLVSGREDLTSPMSGSSDSTSEPATVIQNYRAALVQLRSQLGALVEQRRKETFGANKHSDLEIAKGVQESRTGNAALHCAAEDLAHAIVQSAPGIPLAHAIVSATAVAYLASLLYPTPPGKIKDQRLNRKVKKSSSRNKNSHQRDDDGKSNADQSALDLGLALLLSVRLGRR